MWFLKKACSCIAALTFIFCLPLFSHATQVEYRVGVAPSIAPLQYYENGALAGAHIDLFNQIAKNRYIKFSYRVYATQAKAYEALEEEEIDLVLGACLDKKPPVGVSYSASLTQHNVSMMTQENQGGNFYIDSAQSYSALILQDIFDSDEFVPLPNISYWINSSAQQAHNQFALGNINYLIAPRASLTLYKKHAPNSRSYTISDAYISTVSYCLAIPSTSKPLLQLLNNEILQMKMSGQMGRITGRWINEDVVSKRLVQQIFSVTMVVLCFTALAAFAVLRINKYLGTKVLLQTAELIKTNEKLQEQVTMVRNTNELKECLIQNNTRAIIIFNEEGRITIFNDTVRRFANQQAIQIGTNVWELEFVNRLIGDRRTILFSESCKAFAQEISFPDPIGVFRTYQYDVFPLYTVTNNVRAITLMVSDVTEEKRLRDQINEQEKNQALNRIVAGMAHEIRNPMTTIRGFFELLPRKKEDLHFQKQMAELVPSEIDRINNLITQLIEYAKPAVQPKTLCALSDSVGASVSLMQHAATTNGFAIRLESTPCYAHLSQSQLKQILMNLLLNAIDATVVQPEGERKDIEVSLIPQGSRVCIIVRDYGVGMQGQQLKTCADPFFTTKPTGTGLGLYIVKQYVEQNDGHVQIKSSCNEGTEITCSFPLVAQEGVCSK